MAGLGLAVGLFASACTPKARTPVAPVTVFAAASLTDALGEIATAYENKTGQAVRLSFAASGAVARQIQSGAPADVAILADEVWMDRLEAANALAPGSRADLLRNRLVVVARQDAVTGADPFAWLVSINGKIAIGDPESVPAGTYARTWLEDRGRWDGLQSSIVTAADVRAVRTFVQRGEVALGVVYLSDTVGAPDIKVVSQPPADEQPDILYPVAATTAGAGKRQAFHRIPEGAGIAKNLRRSWLRARRMKPVRLAR